MASGYADVAGTFEGGTQFISSRSNNTGTNGGQILLNGSSGNKIDFANVGVNPPSFSTRSTGTKICLYSVGDTTNVDYAIGIENNNMWLSVPASFQGFNWYAGTTRITRLSGSGVFYIGNGSDFGNGRVNITAAASSRFCDFWTAHAVTQIGSISTNGAVTSYNTTSDYRIKEHVKLIQNATEKVLQLKPCTLIILDMNRK